MLEVDLVQALLANAGLSELVGERITWAKRPEDEALPAIVLHSISSRQGYTTQRQDSLRGALVQMDCVAGDEVTAWALRAALTEALDTLRTAPFQGALIQNLRDAPFQPAHALPASGAADIHQSSLDVRVWHSPA